MKAMTADQVKRLLKTVGSAKGAERDEMLILLALNTGLRRAELCGLNVGDLRGKEVLAVRAETAKRNKARRVPLNKATQAAIKSHLAWKKREGDPQDDAAPFFISRLGNRLCIKALNNVATRWSGLAGLGEVFSPHTWRHTFGQQYIARASNPATALKQLQTLLGHASLGATGIYLHASEEDLRESMEEIWR